MALAHILLLYVAIGILAATGTIAICRSRIPPRHEQTFFALVLVPIAAIYLAFIDYFGMYTTLKTEGIAIGGFIVLTLLGLRFAILLPLAYVLHGAWDLVHEISAHLGVPAGTERSLTAIPLAYGVFCAAYDFLAAGYFLTRLSAWRAARSG